MEKKQINFWAVEEGDKLILEGGYETSTPVTVMKLGRIPNGPIEGTWAWYFRESAPLAVDRVLSGETTIYRVPPEDPYEYAATWLDMHARKETYWDVLESEWGTLEEAQEEARVATEIGNKGAKVVRRRKAGEPEDYDV